MNSSVAHYVCKGIYAIVLHGRRRDQKLISKSPDEQTGIDELIWKQSKITILELRAKTDRAG